MVLSLLFLAVACALPLQVRITSDVTELNPITDTYDVQFSITSTHTAPLVLVKWFTPLDKIQPFPSDMFYIRSLEGRTAPVYIGIAQKRFPIPSDFVTIQPGETLKVSFDLLKGYWFSSLGKHEVIFSSSILVHDGLVDTTDSLENFESIPLASSPLFVDLTNRAPMPSLSDWTVPWKNNSVGTITAFTNCSANTETQSRSADTTAGNLVNNVNSYLSPACSTSLSRYITWFGACDANRYRNVQNHFTAIRSRITSGYRMYCMHKDCGAGVYAYVYPNDSTYTVYACSGYHNAPACAYDSKPGTIIHELSHFSSVAGTQDYAYGTTACQNLARTDPARATNNADNHEYMAESGC